MRFKIPSVGQSFGQQACLKETQSQQAELFKYKKKLKEKLIYFSL